VEHITKRLQLQKEYNEDGSTEADGDLVFNASTSDWRSIHFNMNIILTRC